jgi:hypothetical protein
LTPLPRAPIGGVVAPPSSPSTCHCTRLKDRVADTSEFVDALKRVAAGGTALDPEVVSQLVAVSPVLRYLQTYGLSRSRVLVTRLTAPFSGVPAIAPCGRVVGFLRRWDRFHPHLGVGQSLPLGRRW